jgi:transcriptional regulator with XRE-family HTH domain
VSRSYLSQLEKGSFYASLKIIGRLAEALEVDRPSCCACLNAADGTEVGVLCQPRKVVPR